MDKVKYIQALVKEIEVYRQKNIRLTEKNDELKKTNHSLQDKIKELLANSKG